MSQNAQNLLSIGAVARLTGLTTHSLRKWEDRYQVVTPLRSDGGDRRYTSVQVARLTLLKELVDCSLNCGHLNLLCLKPQATRLRPTARLRTSGRQGGAWPRSSAPV